MRYADDFDERYEAERLRAQREREYEEERQRFEAINQLLGELETLALEQWPDSYAFDYLRGKIDHLEAVWAATRERSHTRPIAYTKKPIPIALRKQVFERDGYRCVTCGDWHNLACDHIIPESKGGPATLENLQTMCQHCNSSKGART